MTLVEHYLAGLMADFDVREPDATPAEREVACDRFIEILEAMSRTGTMLSTIGFEPADDVELEQELEHASMDALDPDYLDAVRAELGDAYADSIVHLMERST